MPKRGGSCALKKWVKAAKAHGYMCSKQGFKKLPKKGSEAYCKIKATYESMKCTKCKKGR